MNEQATSETSQLNWLNGFLHELLANRAAWKLGSVFWYAGRSLSSQPVSLPTVR